MSDSPAPVVEHMIPTVGASIIFRVKSLLLQGRRVLTDAVDRSAKKTKKSTSLIDRPVIGDSRSALWTESDHRERALVAGKIQNLRLAVARIDGCEVEAGEVFSFWKNVGRANKRRGFVAGRELREGCIIPNVGGGLCQLSNALFESAVKANLEIVERHAHTQVIPGSNAEKGRDATVFWNYVDLRFRSPRPFRIEASLSKGHLSVRLRGEKIDQPVLHQLSRTTNGNGHLGSCATCGIDDCFRSMNEPAGVDFGRTAFLVDEFMPEFDDYIRSTRKPADQLFIPIDGKRFRRANYAWDTNGFSTVRQNAYLTAVRSYRSRRLAAQGAERQRNLLAMYERLAEAYARSLSYDVLHVVAQQQLLPYLWRDGHLGGRTFDVLMNALPMAEIQSRLDAAARLHPESTTLGDFRADAGLLSSETDALAAARKVITPHTDIADMFAERAERIEWNRPEPRSTSRIAGDEPVIVFPASTVGRKGCYELREAIRGLNVRLLTLGPYIEGADFWQGFDVERGGDDWLARADLVVLPAFVEHRPHRLILAAASGIPVIASEACGVTGLAGVTAIPAAEAIVLRDRIVKLLSVSVSSC